MILHKQVDKFLHIGNDFIGLQFFERFLLGGVADEGDRIDACGFGGSDVIEAVADIDAGIVSSLEFLAGIENSAGFRFGIFVKVPAQNRSETMGQIELAQPGLTGGSQSGRDNAEQVAVLPQLIQRCLDIGEQGYRVTP